MSISSRFLSLSYSRSGYTDWKENRGKKKRKEKLRKDKSNSLRLAHTVVANRPNAMAGRLRTEKEEKRSHNKHVRVYTTERVVFF